MIFFFSISGNNLNGNNYINNAIVNGAKIIVSNLKFEGFNKNKILFIHSKNPRKLLAEVSSRYYNTKPKNIIAVTGTNGKTSIANFYYQILNLNKKNVAAIGTLGVVSKKFNFKTNNTTIDPIKIHKILKKLKKFKIDNVILEASSHGLKQYRLNGINFNTAIFTNLSRDHLDYHKTFKDYLNSKLILFTNLLKKGGNIVFDDKIIQAKNLNYISKKRKLKKFNFGKNSFINITSIEKINDQQKVNFSINNKKYSFKTSLIGKIQIKNLMFAFVAAYLSKIKINDILRSIAQIKSVSGRLEKVGIIKNKSKIFLDYAHTPEALKTIIFNIRDNYPLSKISLVFGCGGNRDKNKRSIMGNIASKYCDRLYLTDDNPRLENPKLIRNHIKKGIKKNNFIEISSRAEAISTAVDKLCSGDILIVAGKGHENYQEYKKKKFFSDKLQILKAINKKNKSLSKSLRTNILNEVLKNKPLNKNNFINSASINSKKINKNSIFIGVKGKKFNGNFYAKEALRNGSLYAISNKRYKNSKIIFAQDPLNTFSYTSSLYRKSLDANNIAITGSAGKTSVKELTGFCLSKLAKKYYSKKSFNNKYGVPLSLFNTPENAKFAVFEVGMDKKGEIDFLSKLIKPNLGIITNISYAHIKNFKNLNQIQAKGELIDNILPGGSMVINMDDKYYRYLLKKAKKRKLRITTYSKKKINADIILLNKKKIYKTHIINLKIKGEKKSFLIPNDLSNYTENIIATISILINYFDIEKINKNIFLGFNIPKGRGSIINIYKGSKKITIIDESYNSNPLSLKFALERFDAGYKQNNRKFLLIGNMLELGRHTKKLHMEIARYINKSKVNKTYVYGKFTKTYI